MALTPKQERFVAEYLIDLNATQAAVRAGYSAKTAEQQGYQLLQHPLVSAEIARRQKAVQAKLADKYEVTQDRIVAELARIGFSNMQDYMAVGADGLPRLDWANLTRDQAAALSEVTVEQMGEVKVGEFNNEEVVAPVRKVKFKLADKRAALVDLGKHLGMFVERVELKKSPLDDFDAATLEAIGRGAAARLAEAGAGDPASVGATPARNVLPI